MPQVRPHSASGVIAAGGTAQVLMGANPERNGWWIQNTSAGDLWIDDCGVNPAQIPVSGTVCDSFRLVAGASYSSVPGAAAPGSISIFGATTGQNFSAREA
jgi:hypothetical protein